ncbi:MAG TPA: amino acid permease [Bacteroidota bacterium]|nr:amino acid permease [Bacteroidota bacterium]
MSLRNSFHQGDTELPRELSLLDSTMVNVGSMIGSGIFLVPATIALYCRSSSLIIGVWIFSGVVSLFGALSIAELGTLMPRAGGMYVYLTEIYGRLWGFLYGWCSFVVINTASIAAVAVTFALSLGALFPMTALAVKIVAIASILLLTFINCFGIALGAMVQNVFTITKIAALAFLALLSFALSHVSRAAFSPVLPDVHFSSLAGTIVLALGAALWSYDGWIEITYVAGEVRNPDTTISRSLFLSTLIVIVVYTLVNLGMVNVLSVFGMARSTAVASDTASHLLGSAGVIFIASAVAISTFGTNNGFIFTCPRIYYAMARDGVFFRWLAYVHPRTKTPIPSLIAQAVLSSLLVLSGSFEQLYTYVVFVSWIFYALSAVGVIILRRRQPRLARPYKTWGYPATPLLFVMFALYLVVQTIAADPRDSIFGVVIVLLGLPMYLFWQGRSKRVESQKG